MQKEKRRFSRQSTTQISTTTNNLPKEGKIQRKQKSRPPLPPKNKQQKGNAFKQDESIITHLTRKSIFDRKSSQSGSQRTKSLAISFKGRYRQPGVFGVDDKTFINLYINDPFAKQKIDYVVKKNEQRLDKDRIFAATVRANMDKSIQELYEQANSRVQKTEQIRTEKTFIRCKSESDLIQARECLHYKELITSNTQCYSGYTA